MTGAPPVLRGAAQDTASEVGPATLTLGATGGVGGTSLGDAVNEATATSDQASAACVYAWTRA